MRRREEQRRKLHERLISMLYPPPSPGPSPSPPSMAEERNEDGLSNILPLSDAIPVEEVSSRTSSDGGGDGKLTRAQRKRLRKRKLKEDAARRGKMIGPLLPVSAEEDVPEHGRRNDSESCNERVETEETGAVASCSGENKVKQRRRARKLAKTRSAIAKKLDSDVERGSQSS